MPRSRASASYTITATDRTRAGVASARTSLRSLDNVVSKLGVNFSIMSSLAAAAPLGIVAANAPVIDSYGKLSEKLGIAVESVQGFIDASERAGIAQNSLFTSLQRGVRRVSEAANGIGEARGALDELGLSAVELENLSPEDRILSILDAIRQLGDEGDRVRIAAKIFDSEGVDLVRLTGDAVRDATSNLVNMQRALTEIDVAQVETMNDEFQVLQAQARSAGQIFTAEMAPAITGLIRLITGAGDSMGGFRDVSQNTSDVFIDVIGAIGNGVEGLNNIFDSVAIGLQGLNVLAARAGAITGNDDAVERLREAEAVFQSLKDNLAGQTGDATFWQQLEASAAAARTENEAAAEELDQIRAQFKDGIDVSLNAGESNLSGGSQQIRDQALKGFEGLVAALATESEKIEAEYQRQLDIIDNFSAAYPNRINEATEQAARALAQRNAALNELNARRDEALTGERTEASISFNGVVNALATETEKIDAEYNKQLEIIEAYQIAFPERAAEAGEQAIRALEANNARHDALEARRQEAEDRQREETFRPLEANFDQIRNQYATETDIVIEETKRKIDGLTELGALDADRKAEADALIIALEEDKQRTLTQIQQEANNKKLISDSNYAAQSLGILSSLVSNTGALGDRSKKAAARLSQVEALVAGISAAERARNHASLTGGVVSGGIAAAFSWASTIANVAGIEAALQGGTPGGPTGGGSVGSGSVDTSAQRNLESGNEAQQVEQNITFVIDDRVFSPEGFNEMTTEAIANASSSRELRVDTQSGLITRNTESAS